MNVFTNTKKSINFFLGFFSDSSWYEDSIKQYVDRDYSPVDRKGAIYELENRKQKPTTLMFK